MGTAVAGLGDRFSPVERGVVSQSHAQVAVTPELGSACLLLSLLLEVGTCLALMCVC